MIIPLSQWPGEDILASEAKIKQMHYGAMENLLFSMDGYFKFYCLQLKNSYGILKI